MSCGTRDFDFDPNKIFLNEDPRAYIQTSLGTALHHPFVTSGTLVRAGTTASVNGSAFTVVNAPPITDGMIREAGSVLRNAGGYPGHPAGR